MKQFTNIAYWISMAVLLFWLSYTKGWILTNFPSITKTEALALLSQDTNISLLDVRTVQEYKEGHLPDATLIPLDKLEANINKLSSVKKKKLIVYCRSGSRSMSASRILEKHGYTVLNLKGGISQFKKSELVK